MTTPNHSDRAHAILSASFAGAWIECAAAPLMSQALPDDKSDESKEGTIAHEGLDQHLNWVFLKKGKMNALSQDCYTKEMRDGAIATGDIVMEIYNELRAANEPFTILLEQKLDFSRWVPEGFGTGDIAIVSKRRLWLIDYKFGKGIEVDAEDNPQLKLYGLGAIEELGFAFDEIEEVILIIAQPRKNNFPEWRTTKAALLQWAKDIRPQADRAYALATQPGLEPTAEDFKPGGHCTKNFCRARFTCKARADHALAVATQEFEVPGEFEPQPAYTIEPHLLSNEAIASLLPNLEAIEKWAKALQEYAQKQAIENGVKYAGYKVVLGRSNRYITDVDQAAKILKEAGYEEADIYKDPALLGITDLEALVGKKEFAELLKDVIGKPLGKPTLVKASDRRQEWSPTTSADDDFS